MKVIIALIMVAIGVLAALYISLWWGIVEPIMEIARMYDAGTLSAAVVAENLVKFLLKEVLAILVFYVFAGTGLHIFRSR